GTSTRSPWAMLFTAGPTATTVPTASWPKMRPSTTAGTSPLSMCRSVPQMVVVSTWTTMSVGSAGLGSGTVSQDFWPGPWYTSAFTVTSRTITVIACLLAADARPARKPAGAHYETPRPPVAVVPSMRTTGVVAGGDAGRPAAEGTPAGRRHFPGRGGRDGSGLVLDADPAQMPPDPAIAG